jgi:hypothetical protein
VGERRSPAQLVQAQHGTDRSKEQRELAALGRQILKKFLLTENFCQHPLALFRER